MPLFPTLVGSLTLSSYQIIRRSEPGYNRLEKPKRRVCFVWKDDDAHEVEVVDYH